MSLFIILPSIINDNIFDQCYLYHTPLLYVPPPQFLTNEMVQIQSCSRSKRRDRTNDNIETLQDFVPSKDGFGSGEE